MKKFLLFIMTTVLLLTALAVFASASFVQNVIEFELQPQNYTYPEYSTAMYTVKAKGNYLRAFWYLEWQGKTYDLTDNTNATEPWEAYAGEAYGANAPDANTFTYFFGGIGKELDGAYIWCVVEDGHFDLVSEKARITVSGEKSPPEIVSIPSKVEFNKGSQGEIRCVARANGDSQLSFIWYETSTGKLENIIAVNRGSETSDYLFCDTSTVGTRYYVCGVSSTDGGSVYSSVVKVTVKENIDAPRPVIQTQSLPEGTVGQSYSAAIVTSDPKASLVVYYNPGRANDFEKTGLSLSSDGKLSGTPKAEGSFTFTVCSSGEGGEDYFQYTLVVKKAQEVTTPVKTEAVTTAAVPEKTEPQTETKAELPVQTAPETSGGEAVSDKTPETDKPSDDENEKASSVDTTVIVLGVVIAVLCMIIGTLAGILFAKKK